MSRAPEGRESLGCREVLGEWWLLPAMPVFGVLGDLLCSELWLVVVAAVKQVSWCSAGSIVSWIPLPLISWGLCWGHPESQDGEANGQPPVINVLGARDSSIFLCPVKFPEPPFVWRHVYISKEIGLAAVEDHKDGSEEAVWLCARPHINSGRHDLWLTWCRATVRPATSS